MTAPLVRLRPDDQDLVTASDGASSVELASAAFASQNHMSRFGVFLSSASIVRRRSAAVPSPRSRTTTSTNRRRLRSLMPRSARAEA